jgi:hypothetical protein
MSYKTNENWFYKVVGRNVHLWQYVDSAGVADLAGYKIRLPDSYYGVQLVYPSEDITNGLMFEGTAYVEPFVNVDPNELDGFDNPTLTEETAILGTLNEDSHVNLNRFLSLAIVDYIKAMSADSRGDLGSKEYYMKEFWRKIGDNASNKKMFALVSPTTPHAVR